MTSEDNQPQGIDYRCSSCDIFFKEVIQEAEARCPSCLKITSVAVFEGESSPEHSVHVKIAFPYVFAAITLVWVLLAGWVIFQTRTSMEASQFFRLGAWATVASLLLIGMEHGRMAVKNRPKAAPWTPDAPLSD